MSTAGTHKTARRSVTFCLTSCDTKKERFYHLAVGKKNPFRGVLHGGGGGVSLLVCLCGSHTCVPWKWVNSVKTNVLWSMFGRRPHPHTRIPFSGAFPEGCLSFHRCGKRRLGWSSGCVLSKWFPLYFWLQVRLRYCSIKESGAAGISYPSLSHFL